MVSRLISNFALRFVLGRQVVNDINNTTDVQTRVFKKKIIDISNQLSTAKGHEARLKEYAEHLENMRKQVIVEREQMENERVEFEKEKGAFRVEKIKWRPHIQSYIDSVDKKHHKLSRKFSRLKEKHMNVVEDLKYERDVTDRLRKKIKQLEHDLMKTRSPNRSEHSESPVTRPKDSTTRPRPVHSSSEESLNSIDEGRDNIGFENQDDVPRRKPEDMSQIGPPENKHDIIGESNTVVNEAELQEMEALRAVVDVHGFPIAASLEYMFSAVDNTCDGLE